MTSHTGEGERDERLREFNAGREGPTTPGQLYGRLFYLLHRSTDYISQVATYVKFIEIDQFLQTVMFSLYGNHQCEAEEEHLLLRVFRTLMAGELANAQSINEFFRQNSVLTRMLTTYTRRGPGFRYINVVQGAIVRELAARSSSSDEKLSLEINPSKVFEELAAKYRAEHEGAEIWGEEREAAPPPEEHADLPYVKEAIAARVPVIEGYMERLLSEYERHVDDVPYEMRWICRQVKELIRARWHRVGFEQVCTMIGGFFILRFLNPALISPAEYGVPAKEDGSGGNIQLSQEARRNLTVIAKVQQNLSNSVRFSETKERFMTPLNCIFDRLSTRFLRFLDALTEVDDLDHHLSLDSYVRLAKLDKEERITVTANELYFMHDLLLRNKDSLIAKFGAEDDLCALLGELPPAPQKLPRSQDYDVVLKLIPPAGTGEEGEEGGHSELLRMPPEALFGEAEYHLFNIACGVTEAGAFDKEKDAELVAFVVKVGKIAKDKRLKEHAKKMKDVLEALQEEGAITGKNNFLPLRKALASDIDDIPARVARAEADYARLKEALDAIEKRQKDLVTQIETYGQYLDNVRTRSMSTSAGKGAPRPAPSVAVTATKSQQPVVSTDKKDKKSDKKSDKKDEKKDDKKSDKKDDKKSDKKEDKKEEPKKDAKKDDKKEEKKDDKKSDKKESKGSKEGKGNATTTGSIRSGASKRGGSDKKKKKEAAPAAAPESEAAETSSVVVSIKELSKTGVLESVAEEVGEKGATDMKFSVLLSGAIVITGLTKKKEAIEELRVEIVWDELLGAQADGKKTVKTSLFVYNVNAMVFFVNKNIFAKK